MSHLSRRELIARLACAPLLARSAVRALRGAPSDIRIAIAGELGDAREGVDFGLAEAQQTAQLVGRTLTLVRDVHQQPSGVVAAGPPFPQLSVPVVSLGEGGARCVFAVGLSASERADAIAKWRQAHGGAPPALEAAEWHPSLTKFGASELNDRFLRRTGKPMTPAAWRGWFAVKALAEAALRSPDLDCDAFARVRIDGHKGRVLSFDPATRRLLQPIYIVSTGAVIGEIE
jgi:hypothetical protein